MRHRLTTWAPATPEAISILLAVDAHGALILGLIGVSATLEDPSFLTVRRKLLETLLRSLKTLYVDVVKVVGPRAWGCAVIGASVLAEERQDVRPLWSVSVDSVGQGEQRDPGAMEGVEGVVVEPEEPNLAVLADNALRSIYGTHGVPGSAAGPSGLLPETAIAPTPVLRFLLRLLRSCSGSDERGTRENHLVSDTNRLRLADMICTFLSGTIRHPNQQIAVVAGSGVTEALHCLIGLGNGKVSTLG